MTSQGELHERWLNRESPFFGERYDAPSHDNATQVDTPVGEACFQCDRAIEEGDQGLFQPVGEVGNFKMRPVHLGCNLGTSIGHTFGFCHCSGWDDYYWRGKALLQHLEFRKSIGR